MNLDGIIPVWKPANYTSHDIVHRIRRITKQKKVGHTGTLDPAAIGVLPICVGKATRVAEYVQDLPKTYEAVLTLGIATDTQDHEGTVIERRPVDAISKEHIERVFQSFVGRIEQVPPMYSAIKVEGQPLYKYARMGKEIARKPRSVHIYRLKILHIEEGDYPKITFSVNCSKGTYIRTLCVDIGQSLGYPAHLSHLVRTKNGPFSEQDCVTLDDLERCPVSEWSSHWVRPIDEAVKHFPAYVITTEERKRVATGRPLTMRTDTFPSQSIVRIYENDDFIALYRLDETGERATPVKVFVENQVIE